MSGTQAVEPNTASPKLVPSPDGAQVRNTRTGLSWARCVEGMQWNGKTCIGEPLLLDHAQALARVSARSKAEGLRWRLPRVTELQQLVNQGAKSTGLDPALFPAAPTEWHWSATANVRTSQVNPYSYGNVMQGRNNDNTGHMAFLHGWAVDMGTGEARGDVAKRSKLPVRLVYTQE